MPDTLYYNQVRLEGTINTLAKRYFDLNAYDLKVNDRVSVKTYVWTIQGALEEAYVTGRRYGYDDGFQDGSESMMKKLQPKTDVAFCTFPDYSKVKLDSYTHLTPMAKMSNPLVGVYKDQTNITWTNGGGRKEDMTVPTEWISYEETL